MKTHTPLVILGYHILRSQPKRGTITYEQRDLSFMLAPHGASIYRRFIAGPTLNNSKKKVEFFWKLSLNVVENVAKVEFFFF